MTRKAKHSRKSPPLVFYPSHPAVHDSDVPGTLYHAPEQGPAAWYNDTTSMEPLIMRGDVVIMARKFPRPPATGDIIAYRRWCKAGIWLARLTVRADGQWTLTHDNKRFPPETLDPTEFIREYAVVVGWYHPVHRPEEFAAAIPVAGGGSIGADKFRRAACAA